MTRRHKRAPMSENSKHSKNNLKIYVKFLQKKLCGGCRDNIVFLLCSGSKSSYIYIELCCYLIKTPTKLRFPAIIIY